MSPKYKLKYFNGRGLAEPLRWLLAYSGEEFEDIRFERDEWASIKPTTPFGKVPVLEVDGKEAAQSVALARYLGKEAGLGGQDAWEDLQIDIIVDTIGDFRHATPFGKVPFLEFERKTVSQSVAMSRYLGRKAGLGGNDVWEDLQIDIIIDTIGDYRQQLSVFVREQDEKAKAEKKETFLTETIPFYMNKFDAIVKENNGYVANGKLSWADIYFVAMSDVVSTFVGLDILVPYADLSALKEKITSIPKIKAWIDKRPVT